MVLKVLDIVGDYYGGVTKRKSSCWSVSITLRKEK